MEICIIDQSIPHPSVNKMQIHSRRESVVPTRSVSPDLENEVDYKEPESQMQTPMRGGF